MSLSSDNKIKLTNNKRYLTAIVHESRFHLISLGTARPESHYVDNATAYAANYSLKEYETFIIIAQMGRFVNVEVGEREAWSWSNESLDLE